MQESEYNYPDTGTSGLPKGTPVVPTKLGSAVLTPSGNGATIVYKTPQRDWRRVAGISQGSKKLSTKAGQGKLTTRGSGGEKSAQQKDGKRTNDSQ